MSLARIQIHAPDGSRQYSDRMTNPVMLSVRSMPVTPRTCVGAESTCTPWAGVRSKLGAAAPVYTCTDADPGASAACMRKTSPSTQARAFPSPAVEPGVYGKVGSRYSGGASRAGSGATLTAGAPDGVARSAAADGVAGPLAAGPPNPPPGAPVPRPVTLTAAGTAAAASTTAAAPAPATPTRRRRRISRDRVRTRVSRPVPVGATSARSRKVSRRSMSTSFISSPGGDVPIGDRRAQPRQRPRRLNPDVHRRAAEHLGDPVVGKVLVEPQYEDGPLAAGQRGEQ